MRCLLLDAGFVVCDLLVVGFLMGIVVFVYFVVCVCLL